MLILYKNPKNSYNQETRRNHILKSIKTLVVSLKLLLGKSNFALNWTEILRSY